MELNSQKGINPMNMKVSLLFFGIPTLGMLMVFYLVLPWLEKLNLTPFERLVLIITVPMALLFACRNYYLQIRK